MNNHDNHQKDNQKDSSKNIVEEFNSYRSEMNEKILSADNIVLKRIFNLDTNCYAEGSVSVQSKEMNPCHGI